MPQRPESPVTYSTAARRRRLLIAVGSLALAFGMVGLLSNLVEDRLGLEVASPQMLAYDAGLGVVLTLVGAFILWRAIRPIETALRREHEAAARASQALEAVISAAPVGIVTIDAEGVATGTWNPAAEQIFGWTRDEVVGRPLPFVPTDRQGEFAALRRQALAGIEVHGVHLERQRKDGTPVHVNLRTARLPGREGSPDEIVAVLADISEQVRTRGVLAFQSTIIEQLSDPVIAYDPRFEVTFWNRAAEDLYGWTAAEMVGTYANHRLSLVPIDGTMTTVRDRLLAEGRYQGEFLQRRKDGTEVRVESRSAVLRADSGELIGFVSVNRDLTERRRLKTELAESRASFERLVENLPDVIFRYRLTPEPRYEYVSRAVLAMSGYAPEEFYANPALALAVTHPEDLPRLEALLADPSQLGGEPVVLRFLRPDGSVYWTENRHTLVRDAFGGIEAIEWVARDITARVEAAEQLRASEARFRLLSENAPDIIYRYRVRPDRGFEYVSPAAAALSGYPVEAFYEDPDFALRLLPEEAHGVIETLGTRPEELHDRTLVLPWRRADGRVVWVEQRNVLVRDAQGDVVAFEGIARDITERKELEERYARLSQVVEQAAEVVIITDLRGDIVYVNPAFERVTGFAAIEVVGKNPRLLKSGLQGPEVYAALWGALGRGESWSGRVRNRRKDGSIHIADVLISPVRNTSGVVSSYVGLQRDVTRESELDEQLRQAQKMEAVGQLTGGIAHDFNNLLTVVLANAALIEEPPTVLSAHAVASLREIQAAATRGSEMVRKLLAFTRQERLRPRGVDLGQLVTDFLQTLTRILPSTIEIDTRRPDQPLPALADPGAVEQILLNLATNARDAMPGGGRVVLALDLAEFDAVGEKTVSGWFEPGRFVHLSFRDTGTGMPRADLDRIFEPFFTTKPTGRGSGLGMPMVYGLMKQHGGFVTVDSEPGAGTTVHLYFPEAPGQGETSAPAGPTWVEAGGGESILLVEDEDAIRRVATRVLESLGYRVLAARDGVEALDIWRANRDALHLVLTDVVMPRLNGPGLVARIREEGGQVRVLFATGYASTDVMAEHLHSGESAQFIEKPWTMDQLAQRVREVLGAPGPDAAGGVTGA